MASFEIKRRNGDVRTVLVDDDDVGRIQPISQWRLKIQRASRTVYVQRDVVDATGRRFGQFLHQLLLDAGGLQVDHKNGNGLDNRRSVNLRKATPSQNRCNVGLKQNNTSGVKGVSWDKRSGKWRASIKLDGKQRSLGHFASREAAHEAYRRAASELHGEFANAAIAQVLPDVPTPRQPPRQAPLSARPARHCPRCPNELQRGSRKRFCLSCDQSYRKCQICKETLPLLQFSGKCRRCRPCDRLRWHTRSAQRGRS